MRDKWRDFHLKFKDLKVFDSIGFFSDVCEPLMRSVKDDTDGETDVLDWVESLSPEMKQRLAHWTVISMWHFARQCNELHDEIEAEGTKPTKRELATLSAYAEPGAHTELKVGEMYRIQVRDGGYFIQVGDREIELEDVEINTHTEH